ncbi:MAG: prepilin-type N-terminal cleavage/methylation domain-containing protein, partial [Eubacterium sp.]|nr:prepilin-type N-terminal cleavage/methylation domain-containing protein [Eubacterium sp.]
KKLKGFTLVEMIVTLAIIAALTGLLVPSVTGYVVQAKKRATVESGKQLWTAVTGAIYVDEEAKKSFYSDQSGKNWTAFEARPDGSCVNTDVSYKNSTYVSTKKYTITNTPSQIQAARKQMESSEDYFFTVVTRVDGSDHPANNRKKAEDKPTDTNWNNPLQITDLYNTWYYSDNAYKPFVERMCHLTAVTANIKNSDEYGIPLKMAFNGREDGGSLPLVRWLIVYNIEEPSQIEIWAGDGHKAANGPVYRVYPNPNEIYLN